jgi:hypothetical protein
MRSRLSLAPILALALFVSACATTQVQKSRQVAVDVHATLAAVQDAEASLYAAGTVPAWTQAKHQQFNAHLVIALKAGKALTEGVGTLPIPAGTKLDLVTVSEEVKALNALIAQSLPADSAVAKAVGQVTDDILSLLPLFLS